MSTKKSGKSARAGSDGYWEKYFILAGGISPDWDCYALRDFVKPITERIWVNVDPYVLENPPRTGQVGSITVNGREDAERLYLTLLHYKLSDGRQFLIHLWNITDDNTSYVRCNCDMHGLTRLCPPTSLEVYMNTQARTKPRGPLPLQIPPPSPYLPQDNRFLAIAGMGVPPRQSFQYPPNPYFMGFGQPPPENLYPLGWNHIQVIPRPNAQEMDYREVYVGQLHYNVTKENLQIMFHEAGLNPTYISLGKRNRGRPAGTASVIFPSLLEAVRAISLFNGYQLLGRRITVRYRRSNRALLQGTLDTALATPQTVSSTPSEFSMDSSTSSESSEQSSNVFSPPIVNGSRL